MSRASRRVIKALVRQLAEAPDARQALLALMAQADRQRFANMVEDQPNGSEQLQAWYQAIADAADSMDDIGRAIADGDIEEAQHLTLLAHQSLTEHQDELKGLL